MNTNSSYLVLERALEVAVRGGYHRVQENVPHVLPAVAVERERLLIALGAAQCRPCLGSILHLDRLGDHLLHAAPRRPSRVARVGQQKAALAEEIGAEALRVGPQIAAAAEALLVGLAQQLEQAAHVLEEALDRLLHLFGRAAAEHRRSTRHHVDNAAVGLLELRVRREQADLWVMRTMSLALGCTCGLSTHGQGLAAAQQLLLRQVLDYHRELRRAAPPARVGGSLRRSPEMLHFCKLRALNRQDVRRPGD
eukprot:scaffold2375_cov107-Isochrysis_galbana.AAC.7